MYCHTVLFVSESFKLNKTIDGQAPGDTERKEIKAYAVMARHFTETLNIIDGELLQQRNTHWTQQHTAHTFQGTKIKTCAFWLKEIEMLHCPHSLTYVRLT